MGIRRKKNQGGDNGENRREHGEGIQEDEAQNVAWDDLVLDEEFVRGAQTRESAARTRMLQERWRKNPPEPEPWRADEPPAGWFFSKIRRPGRKRRRKDR